MPTQLPYVATVREENIATFDALTDLDGLHFDQASQKTLGGLHYDALSTAQANATVPMPAATLIWQTTGEHGWLNYDVPTQGVEAGDTLIILATNHRSSGSPYMTSATVDGVPVTFHVQERVTQGVRIGMTIASITLGSTMPVAALWGALPLGGGVSIWRIKGGASLSAGSFGYDTNLGPFSVGLTADLPGTTLMLAYAVDTGAGIAFSGDGTVLTEGPGNTNAAYFTARQSVQAGGTASLALAPSGVPSHACGMVAVAVG